MTNSENRNILFVINPISGNNQKTNVTAQIERICNKYSLFPEFIETTGENDKEKIANALQSQNPETAVAVGGDGTVNLVASLLIGSDIKLGIIPTGSANGMAFELNIPSNLEQAMAVIARDVSRPIDLLKINREYLAIHLSDLGMNARIIKRFDQEKIRGLYGYARQFFKELKSPSHFKCIVDCEGKKRRKYKAVMIVMTNTHFFGTGAVVNPTGKLDDAKFEIVVIKPYPWYYIFHMVFAFFTGNIHRLRHIRTLSCQRATLKMKPAPDLQVDGEPVGKLKQLEVEVIPAAIHIIYNHQENHFFVKS
ncbi:diacylglycerol kinase family protein [Marinilabilia sp.]|uniref:diacylglycerol/lipid kinase family protein n=1 Tax=Marinilabilia sp. TaxID=2021252 RepID=UPI0025C6B58C|nr:diacylglycerol kinase family protein [Marinilabilia sp.]